LTHFRGFIFQNPKSHSKVRMAMFQPLNFTKKYILALSLIALLSILAYFNLNHLINKQSNDGEIINMSGKQRMLSQKIALFAINYKTEELNENVKAMEVGHGFLTSLVMSDEVQKIYYDKPIELDKRVKLYILHGKKFYNNRNGKSLTYILNNSQILLKDLDFAVSVYQKESELKVSKLKDIELLLLILTLIILVCEAFFIFKPVNTKIALKTQALIDEKNFSDTITESNTNAIISVGSDFKVRTYNKSAIDIFGYSKSEMIGHDSLLKIVPLLYQNAHRVGLSQFFKTGKFKFNNKVLELTAIRKSGQTFPIRISFGTNESKTDKIVVANIQDITDELDKDAKFLQQSRYAAMGEMIGNIAHQWRQPLSAISTISSGAKIRKIANIIDDDEIIEVFDKITNHTKYLSRTIDNFRNFFEKSENEALFDIKKVVSQVIELTDAIYKSNNIEVFVKMKDSISCKGNEGELSQVFMNIFNNSKDALIENKIENKILQLEIEKMHNNIIINFRDNANGIKPEIINNIFEPYFTTKHKSQGTGIGLYMSKEIIEKHFHGILSVENEKFKINDIEYFGACFTIKIPIFEN